MKFRVISISCACMCCAAASASFLVPTEFPKSVADLSFIDRLALKHSGYEYFESEYDDNGNCISGCSYAMPNWEDELTAMARWNRLSHQNLTENHGYTENPDGTLTQPPAYVPPVDEQPQPPVEFPPQPPEQPVVPTKDCAVKNSSFENRGIPYRNPLGYKACITSYYGPRSLFGRKFHYGMDFAAVSGTPVYAPADGVVKVVFVQNRSCGNGLVIEHSDGYSTKYCHFESVAVRLNEKVAAGCLIGKSDNTGQSTGPHLHYSVLYKEHPVDPIDFIEPGHQSCYKKK